MVINNNKNYVFHPFLVFESDPSFFFFTGKFLSNFNRLFYVPYTGFYIILTIYFIVRDLPECFYLENRFQSSKLLAIFTNKSILCSK
jgi:hypothetical protein